VIGRLGGHLSSKEMSEKRLMVLECRVERRKVVVETLNCEFVPETKTKFEKRGI